MISLYECGARILVERGKEFLVSPLGSFLYGLVVGIVGILILLLFFTMIFSSSHLLYTLSLILAFNGAAVGFGLAEKNRGRSCSKMSLFGMAVLLTAAGWGFAVLLFPWESLLDNGRYLLSGLSTLAGLALGVWIYNKNRFFSKKED